jgi:hypothetical protein
MRWYFLRERKGDLVVLLLVQPFISPLVSVEYPKC